MFTPKTPKIDMLSKLFPDRIKELEVILDKPSKIYIDFANVRPWAEKLGWHVEPARVKQLFDSFDTVKSIRIYNGTLIGDRRSEDENRVLTNYYGVDFVNKPVKIMQKSVDVSSIPIDSTAILKNFVRPSLLRQLQVRDIEYLNRQLEGLNKRGMLFIEDRKCNFDVEIGRDMLLDFERHNCDSFVLWSGDSDFAGPIEQLLKDGKKVYIFATVRKVASELNDLIPLGLQIYDIQKIKNFICWNKEMDGPATTS